MNTVQAIWVNGRQQATVAANDRAVAFGDGVFETMLWNGATLVHVPQHLQRLQEGLQRLSIDCDLDTVQHELLAAEAYCHEQGGRFAIKVVVSRGPAGFGYLPPEISHPTRLILVLALPGRSVDVPLRATISSLRLSSQPLLAGIKHCNRLEYILARQAAHEEGFDDCLLLDEEDNLIESSSANVFVLEQGCLLTPFIERCGVAGIMRQYVLENADSLAGLPVFESLIPLTRLQAADAVFICNAIQGVRLLSSCDDMHWSPEPRLQLLKQAVDKVVYA